MLITLQNTALATTNSVPEWSIYVFWGIIVLCVALFFYFLRRTDKIIEKEKLANSSVTEVSTSTVAPKEQHQDLHEEAAAAIAMALFLYKRELHDKESFRITLQKVSRIYSPWNSKIYTLSQIHLKR